MFGVSTKICQKIRHNCKNMIYVEGLRKCTSLKVFRHLFIIPRSTIGLISISVHIDRNLQNFIGRSPTILFHFPMQKLLHGS